MKLLHYVEIENFKRYGDIQRIELDHPAVLIGPNNCGKTSALQAIALWSIGLRTWRMESEDSKAVKRTGKALNRLSILVGAGAEDAALLAQPEDRRTRICGLR